MAEGYSVLDRLSERGYNGHTRCTTSVQVDQLIPTTSLNVPPRSVPQSDRVDCLPARVEMVLAFFGRQVKREWLRRVLESSELGTPGFKC
jgi:hypothetical protein